MIYCRHAPIYVLYNHKKNVHNIMVLFGFRVYDSVTVKTETPNTQLRSSLMINSNYFCPFIDCTLLIELMKIAKTVNTLYCYNGSPPVY